MLEIHTPWKIVPVSRSFILWANIITLIHIWTASSEFGTYSLCEQRRFRRACACAQSRQNLRCSHIQAVSHEEPSDRKPDPLPLWMAGHAQLKFVMTECSKTQIRLTGLIYNKTTHKCSGIIRLLNTMLDFFHADKCLSPHWFGVQLQSFGAATGEWLVPFKQKNNWLP